MKKTEKKKGEELAIVTLEQVKSKIVEHIPKVLDEMFTRSYSNPIKDAIENSIKEKDGEIKDFVHGLLKEIIDDAGFKGEVKTALVAKILQVGFKS